MSKEAWKDTGNCRECRRAKYCKHECRASKEAGERRARQIIKSFMSADMVRHRIINQDDIKNELRTTETAIMGECSEDIVNAVYEKCIDLAQHSTFSTLGIVSVLCAECRENKESITIGIKSMDEKLRIIRARGI